jgi:gliding motility-associated lipoprotein GldH
MMRNLVIINALLLMICSCDPQMVYDNYQKTEGGNWSWADKKTFKVKMEDSLRQFNILINIRHTTRYPKSNLFIFITITGPDGNSMRDTVELRVADEHGRWSGYGFGDIKLISRLYKKAATFRRTGEYTFVIEQGMRLQEVPVTDVGLRIEKYIVTK